MVVRISVAGATSRAGKTALAVTLIQSLPPRVAVAIKFTTAEDVFKRCPRGSPCVVCDIDVPFRIIENPAILREPGTDTERLSRAGAARVVWTIAKQTAVAAAWTATLERAASAPALVMEGSTIVPWADPDLLLFVAHPFLKVERWKPTSASLLARADAVIVNRASTERRPPDPAVIEALARHRGHAEIEVADVTRPLGEWSPRTAARMMALAGQAVA